MRYVTCFILFLYSLFNIAIMLNDRMAVNNNMDHILSCFIFGVYIKELIAVNRKSIRILKYIKTYMATTELQVDMS